MVYFITDGLYTKIGIANDPKKRLSEIQVANPNELMIVHVVYGGRKVEVEMHRKFKQFHHRGEWFKISMKTLAELPKTMSHLSFINIDELTLGNQKERAVKRTGNEKSPVRYQTITEASQATGVHHSAISRCCQGKRKTAGGYRWQYM